MRPRSHEVARGAVGAVRRHPASDRPPQTETAAAPGMSGDFIVNSDPAGEVPAFPQIRHEAGTEWVDHAERAARRCICGLQQSMRVASCL
jgi:hypothetical protein